MKKYLLPERGNFYKANLHMHTNISDGKYTPEEVKRLYMEKGYSVVAYTDHEVLLPHPELTDENFVAITSFEIHQSQGIPLPYAFKRCYHLNLYAKDPKRDFSEVWTRKGYWHDRWDQYVSEAQKEIGEGSVPRVYEGFNEIIKKANEEGFLVCYNHPCWSLQNYTDYSILEGLWATEIYNHSSFTEGYEDNDQHFDDMIKAGKDIYPVAADDAHGDIDMFGGWVMIKSESLEYGKIMEALERGDFYASTGPEIKELYVEDGVLHVSTSEAREIFVKTDRRATLTKLSSGGELFTSAEFDLKPYIEASLNCKEKADGCFIRVIVYDKAGKKAYTAAYRLKDFIDACL